VCVCLIAASEGEGFGLPLIEAARHKLAIIARDIAVFREVAGAHALYFEGKEPAALAIAIEDWLALYKSGKHPKSDFMPWVTWRQSSQRLKEILLKGEWYAIVSPEIGQKKRTEVYTVPSSSL
jgi:glycosyltransferase involved in cell wall biosynthesis